MVTVSEGVKQTPALAAEARRRLGTLRNSFLKEGTGSQDYSGEQSLLFNGQFGTNQYLFVALSSIR